MANLFTPQAKDFWFFFKSQLQYFCNQQNCMQLCPTVPLCSSRFRTNKKCLADQLLLGQNLLKNVLHRETFWIDSPFYACSDQKFWHGPIYYFSSKLHYKCHNNWYKAKRKIFCAITFGQVWCYYFSDFLPHTTFNTYSSKSNLNCHKEQVVSFYQ